LTLIVLGATAYFGLAVIGWGGLAAFLSYPARVVLAIVVFALAGVALFAGGGLSPGEREDRGNRWVIAALEVIGVFMGYLPAYTDRHELWIIGGDTIRWLGVVLFTGGVPYGFGRCSSLAIGLAGWSSSSPDTRWSQPASMASFATRAI
jgi:hypothetical protein